MRFTQGNRQQRRAAKKLVEQESKKFGSLFQLIPEESWPDACRLGKWIDKPIKVWRNHRFLVIAYEPKNGAQRLTILRTALLTNGNYSDQISWEELQEIKKGVGFPDLTAVEVFPAEKDVVNVANMRHPWILPEPLPFQWIR